MTKPTKILFKQRRGEEDRLTIAVQHRQHYSNQIESIKSESEQAIELLQNQIGGGETEYQQVSR